MMLAVQQVLKQQEVKASGVCRRIGTDETTILKKYELSETLRSWQLTVASNYMESLSESVKSKFIKAC